MGNQDFGIQSTAVVQDEVADLIFGGGTTNANPADVKPIQKDKNIITKITDDEEVEETPEAVIEVTTDEFLDELAKTEGSDDTTPKATAKPKVETTEPVETDEDDSTFKTLSKNLVDLGIFTQGEAEELPKTAEEFKDKWVSERQEQVNSDIYNFLVSKHGEEGLKAFEDIFVKGVSPKDYLTKFADIQSLKDLDLSSEINQEKVVRESLRRQGLKDDIIDRKIQKLKDYGDLEEEAPIAHELIMRQEETDLAEITQQKEQEEVMKRNQRNEYVNSLQKVISEKLKAKEFDGIPMTDKVARETFDYLSTEKWQLPSGEKLTDFDKDVLELRDPKNIETKLKFGLLMKNKLDLSKIKTSAISKTSSKLFEDLVIKDKNIKRTKSLIPNGSFFEDLNK